MHVLEVGADERRLVGQDDTDAPASAAVLPRYWKLTLKRRSFNLKKIRKRKERLSATLGEHYGGGRLSDYCDSSFEIHEQPDSVFYPPLNQFDFSAALEYAPSDLWPPEADLIFEKLAEVYRGYAIRHFPDEIAGAIPGLAARVHRIVESDRTGRRFMRLDAEEAARYWSDARDFPWLPHLTPGAYDKQAGKRVSLALRWAAGYAFTRTRRHIRWDPFPLRRCTLCGTEMVHLREIAAFGSDAPGRWCMSCIGGTEGFPTKDEAAGALSAFIEATGVIPSNMGTICRIPHDKPGMVRDVMAATRTTIPNEHVLRQVGLWPWNRALVAAGVVGEFVKTPRGYQSEASDGYWCRSIFERQVDDFLTNHRIGHEHEPKWPLHPELNPNGNKRADWQLPDGTMVEAAGMLDDPAYAAKFDTKRALAAQLGVPLLVVTPDMLLTLEKVFKPWMPQQ
ncbi:hypothetical protein ACQI4L_13870 [Mycolicibacterium litorale]|uniref:hypothetical protein n=1 Tax=Mycolicibacterium litorale TaxID=758802 RepID=UPI003CEEA884